MLLIDFVNFNFLLNEILFSKILILTSGIKPYLIKVEINYLKIALFKENEKLRTRHQQYAQNYVYKKT